MLIDCPHGWRHSARFGSITLEDSRVDVYGGLCDSPDLCGIRACEFFNDSEEADRRFRHACNHAQTLEGRLEDEEAKRQYERRLTAGETFTRAEPFRTPEWTRKASPPRQDDDEQSVIPAEALEEMVREGWAELAIGQDEIGVRPTANAREALKRSNAFDGTMAELVDKGYIEPFDTNSDGETLYRFTEKGEAQAAATEKAERRRASRARAAEARLARELPPDRKSRGLTVAPIRTLTGKVRMSLRIDPREFLDPSGQLPERPEYPEEVRYLESIIGFGSTGQEGKTRVAPITCWRRERDRWSSRLTPCHGQLHVTRDDVGRFPEDSRAGIWFVCGGCSLVGVIEGWKGTVFDCSGEQADCASDRATR